MKSDSVFRRNLAIVAALHVAFVSVLFFAGKFQRKPRVENIVWLEGGSIGGGESADGDAEPAAPEPAPAPEPEPTPLPPEPEPEAKPELIKPPSELPMATPEPATPKPTTPKPITPKPLTPKPPTPKPATPKPATAKPATPKKTSPKPSATAVAKATSKPGDTTKATPGIAKSAVAGSTPGTKPGGNGPGSGNGKGPGKTGSGTGASEHGWYFSMIRERFMARWAQPTDIQRGGADVITLVKLRINADGTIASYKIITESGYPQMEESVLRAVEKVTQIDPLPAGLNTDGFLDVPLQFKLDQGQ